VSSRSSAYCTNAWIRAAISTIRQARATSEPLLGQSPRKVALRRS
jgi:hypothetical protein